MVHKHIKTANNLNHMSYYLAQFLRYEYATSVRFFASNSRVVSCFPSFSITWITSSSISRTPASLSFFKCWQLSAITQTFSALNSYWKENIFYLEKNELIVVLITTHYSHNCTKLMHNREVFYTHFPFCLLYLQNKACNICIT